MLLLLLLSRFSRVRLCATPETAAHQSPPSLGFSRQEHWSGLPFPSPMHKVKSQSEVAQVVYLKVIQSCLTPSDPMDCSLPGSPVHGFSGQEYWSGVPLPSPGWGINLHYCDVGWIALETNRDDSVVRRTRQPRSLCELALLWWSGTNPTLSPRYACTI